jgi:hypothetical protein
MLHSVGVNVIETCDEHWMNKAVEGGGHGLPESTTAILAWSHWVNSWWQPEGLLIWWNLNRAAPRQKYKGSVETQERAIKMCTETTLHHWLSCYINCWGSSHTDSVDWYFAIFLIFYYVTQHVIHSIVFTLKLCVVSVHLIYIYTHIYVWEVCFFPTSMQLDVTVPTRNIFIFDIGRSNWDRTGDPSNTKIVR